MQCTPFRVGGLVVVIDIKRLWLTTQDVWYLLFSLAADVSLFFLIFFFFGPCINGGILWCRVSNNVTSCARIADCVNAVCVVAVFFRQDAGLASFILAFNRGGREGGRGVSHHRRFASIWGEYRQTRA